MSEKRKIKVLHVEAQELFVGTVGFKMPEKLGDTPIPYMEQMASEEEALLLYRELVPLAPLYQKNPRSIRFGPANNWERNDITLLDGRNIENYEIVDRKKTIELTLDEDATMGAFRVLLLLMHPGNPRGAQVGKRHDVLWPLAEKLRLTEMLRREIKINERPKKRLELDEIKIDSGNGSGQEEPTEKPTVDSESK